MPTIEEELESEGLVSNRFDLYTCLYEIRLKKRVEIVNSLEKIFENIMALKEDAQLFTFSMFIIWACGKGNICSR